MTDCVKEQNQASSEAPADTLKQEENNTPATAATGEVKEGCGEKRPPATGAEQQQSAKKKARKDFWATSQPKRPWGEPGENSGPRARKHRVALLFGYLGAGYCGLQINGFEVPTVERDLEQALVDAGAISKLNAHALQKVHWSRCARTDKGVSAAANVVALNIVIDPPKEDTKEEASSSDEVKDASAASAPAAEVEKKEEEKKEETPEEKEAKEEESARKMTARINELLPPQIKLYGMKKTTGGFDSRTRCDGRTYQYILPAFCLCTATRDEKTGELHVAEKPDIEFVREAVKFYLGCHNFHNFTVRKQAWEKTCMRYMCTIDVSDVQEIHGMPVVGITIFGQSFMLHQIRKMVAFIIILCRAGAKREWLPKLFQEIYDREKVFIPLAPALGLFLDRPSFTNYNKRFTDPHVPRRGPAPQPILPTGKPEFKRGPFVADDWNDEIEQFKRDVIIPHIVETERRDHVAQHWLDVLDRRMKMGYVILTSEKLITPALPPEEFTAEEQAELNEVDEEDEDSKKKPCKGDKNQDDTKQDDGDGTMNAEVDDE